MTRPFSIVALLLLGFNAAPAFSPTPRPVASAAPKAWTHFIPTDLLGKAHAYVVGKGWLKDGQGLPELPPEHVATILGNQTAFLNLILR